MSDQSADVWSKRVDWVESELNWKRSERIINVEQHIEHLSGRSSEWIEIDWAIRWCRCCRRRRCVGRHMTCSASAISEQCETADRVTQLGVPSICMSFGVCVCLSLVVWATHQNGPVEGVQVLAEDVVALVVNHVQILDVDNVFAQQTQTKRFHVIGIFKRCWLASSVDTWLLTFGGDHVEEAGVPVEYH